MEPAANRDGLYRLNMGCGRSMRQAGWTNCDLHDGPNVDIVCDITKPWPFPDSSASEVYSSHVLEHLHDPMGFFREAYRVLIPNGSLTLRLPYGGHHAAWWDITHVRPWFSENFAVLQPGYNQASGNPQHDDNGLAFGVNVVQLRVSYKMATMLRRWWWRYLFGKFYAFWDHEIEEIWGHFYALKTPEAIEAYRLTHEPNIVGTSFVAYKHHLEGTPPPVGGMVSMVDLGSGSTINGFIGRVTGEEK